MRENNENNQLHCQPALNVVVEIKGPFWEVSNRVPWTLTCSGVTGSACGFTLNLGKTGAVVSQFVVGTRSRTLDPPTKPKVLNIAVELRVAASRLGMGTIERVAAERLIACGLQTNHFRSWSSLPGYVS
jgi:hypothetical protein